MNSWAKRPIKRGPKFAISASVNYVCSYVTYRGGGADLINGGAGNDVLVGHAGNDDIFGQDGNDVIDGGAGNDSLSGVAGACLLYTSPSPRDRQKSRMPSSA